MEGVSVSIEHKDVISNTRLTIVKIHGGFVIFMSVGLAILLASIQPSESQQLFALYGVILAGHAVALIGHLMKIDAYRHLSAFLGVILIPVFPIGTVFGIILLGQATKNEWSQDAEAQESA